MTEEEWRTCEDPILMLETLGERATRRKRQLCALSCYEQASSALEARPPWSASISALRLLQRLPDDEDWMEENSEQEEAWGDVDNAMANRFWEHGARTWAICRDEDLWDNVQAGTEGALTDWNDPGALEAGLVCLVTGQLIYNGYLYSLYGLYPDFAVKTLATRFEAHAAAAGVELFTHWKARKRLLADLVRDCFSHLLRSVLVDTSWFAWNGGTIRHLAEAIYNERAFDRLPILADALEDAGCTDADILDHLRGSGPHVRGCWVLDLLLGKE